MVVKKLKIVILFALLSILIIVSKSETGQENVSFYDGRATPEQIEAHMEAWCEYNEGRDFAVGRCD